MNLILPPPDMVRAVILQALAEDIGRGDVTTQAIIPPDAKASMRFVARERLVASGLTIIGEAFGALDGDIDYQWMADDGVEIQAGGLMATVSGSAHAILMAERVALNLLQRMCGIATETARYVAAAQGTGAKILDTRKTAPLLRELDKYAVRCGGGQNHRMRLDDGILIKDNHIAVAGSVAAAVKAAKENAPATLRIEVECDTLAQVREALAAGADILLLDNMDIATLREAVALAGGRALTEASGGVNLQTVRAIAETGVHFISVGALTHSVKAADIGLDSAT